jgi:hypothetical protein
LYDEKAKLNGELPSQALCGSQHHDWVFLLLLEIAGTDTTTTFQVMLVVAVMSLK